MAKAIGPTFGVELSAAGLAGLPFSWGADGTLTFGAAMDAGQIAAVEAVYAAHDPTAIAPATRAAQLIAAGFQIASTGTPALNGTYAIDTASKATIDGIYAGIKNGDGLPGVGATFNYADIVGAMHAFDETTFPAFAKAARDYLYGISQGESPAQPTVIV